MTVTSRRERTKLLVVNRKKFGTELIKSMAISAQAFDSIIAVLNLATSYEVLEILPPPLKQSGKGHCLDSELLSAQVTPFHDRREKDSLLTRRQLARICRVSRS